MQVAGVPIMKVNKVFSFLILSYKIKEKTLYTYLFSTTNN